MRVRFNEPGLYKVGGRVVDVADGQILDVSASDIERYAVGVHYEVAVETQPIVDPTSDPATGESDEDREKREAAEAAAKPKGGKGAGGK